MLFNLWAQMIAGGGALLGAKCLPWGNNITPNLRTIYTDLGVITVPGILPVNVTWSAPELEPDGSVGILGNLCKFQITDPTQPAQILGFAIFTGPGGSGSGTGGTDTLWYADRLANPIILADVTQIAGYVPQITVGTFGTLWGAGNPMQ
jgi:hypothetical protein